MRVCSVLWVGNPLLAQQWAAVAMVFVGLLVSTLSKARRRPHAAASVSPWSR